MRNELPAGPWQQSMRNARIEDGVLRAQLQKRDGTWVDAQVQLRAPSLANFNGGFIPTESEAHLRALIPAPSSGGGGLTTAEEVQISSSTITALATIGGALIAALA